jgi:UDP-4-amino-4,6-dideoxy-N-acetyl-beta-L-altrosamine N-acetyltransferase
MYQLSVILSSATLRYAFDTLKLHKLCAVVMGNNTRSIRLHKKLGFQLEGRLRQQHFDGTSYIDTLHFGLLAEEYLR